MNVKDRLFNIEAMRGLSIMDLCLVYDTLSRCIDVTFDAQNEPRATVDGNSSPGSKQV